jgi:hypothetical protein
MTAPVVNRLFADLVLLRDFSDGRLVGFPQDSDHLLFGETDLLHGTPLEIREPFSQLPSGPKNLGRSDVRTRAIEKKLQLAAKIKTLQAMSSALDELVSTCRDDAMPLENCPILAALESSVESSS